VPNDTIEKVDKKVLANSAGAVSYSSIIEYAKNLTCEPVLKSNCKMCNSIYRKEAEEFFAEGKSSHFIYKWLKGKNEEISDRAVHNHFMQHYHKPMIEQRMKAYAESLEDYSKIHMEEEQRLNLYLIALDQQIHNLNSCIGNIYSDDMRKSQETLTKLIDQSMKIQEKIRSLKQENEPIKILVERLNNVMTIKWNETKSQEAKAVISEIVDLIVKETEPLVNANK